MICVAPRMIGNPLGLDTLYPTDLSKLQNVQFCKISYEDRVVTLAVRRLDSGKIYIGASMHNPLDTFDVWSGRIKAEERLMHYFQFGVVKKHKDGRSADHFLIVMDESDIKKGWRVAVAKMVYDASFLGRQINMNIVTCCGGC